MKHVHCDIIKAWAEGAEIQYLDTFTNDGIWRDIAGRDLNWHPEVQYRIKPKEEFLKYRVALHKNPDGKFYTISYLSENYNKAERYSGFVTWLIDEQIVNIGWLQ